MEVSNEIKEAVQENAKAEADLVDTVKDTKKASEKKEKREFINLEGSVDKLAELLGADNSEGLAITLNEDADEDWKNLYCENNSLNPSSMGQRVAWHYRKFSGQDSYFYNLNKLVTSGVKVVVKGAELTEETSRKKFLVFNPDTNKLEMYVMGRLALDMLGRRVKDLRGVKRIGFMELYKA